MIAMKPWHWLNETHFFFCSFIYATNIYFQWRSAKLDRKSVHTVIRIEPNCFFALEVLMILKSSKWKKASFPFHTKPSVHTYTSTHSHTPVTTHSCQASQAPPSLCRTFTTSAPPVAPRPGLGHRVTGNLSQPYYFSYQPFQSTSQPSAFPPSFLHLIYFLVFSQQFLQTLSLSTGLINLLFLSSGAVVCCLALQEGSPPRKEIGPAPVS